eukprot:TRINITY_DN1063_c0_g1_i3.p1 TRINITY_DN1063_c0_g1~~TRINITY_DN1063_c0_g1_i3.p1  ORF type:complete len:143 (+),score=67.70 TRINITY_DN1063_c0_g1_i3:93-521(+)
MNAGVKVVDECIDKYNEIKMKKSLRYVTFMIKDKKEVVVDAEGAKEGEEGNGWDAFCKALPEDQPRYALVDVDYETEDGRPQNKLTFVYWSPDDKTSVKDKMIYSSTKDTLKKKFVGIMKEVQANDMTDLAWKDILEYMNRK